MLPPQHRMRARADFAHTARRGRRVSGSFFTLHVVAPAATASTPGPTPALVGFVVSKAVGNAVVRNRTTRRLKHAIRDRLPVLPQGAKVVVRAMPAAASASAAELGQEWDRLITRTLVRGEGVGTARRGKEAE